MDNTLNFGKRVIAAVVAAVTILSTVGFAAFAIPSQAQAATGGDVIKGESLSAVYYYGYDGMRYTFPNLTTYQSWYGDDFSMVETISDSELADIDLADNVTMRWGSYWIKITSDAKTYAVSRDGMIHWIESEEVAEDFAGSDWNTGIVDVPDVFFVDYTAGASLMSATAFDGMMYMDGGDYYLSWDGEMRMVSEDGRSENWMDEMFFLDGEGIDDSSLSAGDDIDGHVCDLTDAAQTGCDEEVVASGDLAVSLSSSTTAGMDVPDTASGVKAATFDFEADEAAELNNLVVTLDGLAGTTAVAGVYLYEGDERLTDRKTVNSSTRQATFTGLSLDFAAGETKTLTVRVDMSDGGTGSFAIQIEESEDVDSDGDVSGSFPITGNTMDIVDVTIGSIEIDKSGSTSNPTLGSNAEIGEFQLTAGGTEDLMIETITLEIDDAGDHDDFSLEVSGDEVATGEDLGRDLVLFTFEDGGYVLEEGQSRQFEVKATIGGQTSDAITVHLDNDADLYAVGQDFGFAVPVYKDATDTPAGSYGAAGGCTASVNTECSYSVVEGGEITISDDSPSSSDIAKDSDNVLLWSANITAERKTEVKQLRFQVDETNAGTPTLEDGPLTDMRLIDTEAGTLLMGPSDFSGLSAGDVSEDVTFTDNWIILAGETVSVGFTADIQDASDEIDTGDIFQVTYEVAGDDFEDEFGDDITDVVPSSDIAGKQHTVVATSLTISSAATPSGARNFVKGEDSVPVASYNFKAGTAEDMEITDATVAIYVDADTAGVDGTFGLYDDETDSTAAADSRVGTCVLYDDEGTPLDTAGVESDGDVDFEDFSLWVMAGSTETVDMYCSLQNVSVADSNVDHYAFAINNPADITALDEEGSSVTPTGYANGPSSDDPATITSPDTSIIVNDEGTMTVAASSDVPTESYIMTSSTDNFVAAFNFAASFEAFEIDRLTILERQAELDTQTTDSSAYANNISKVTIEYPIEDGTMTTASGQLTGNQNTFELTGDNKIYVPKDDDIDVNVYVDISQTDRSGGSAQSNERLSMGMEDDTGSNDFRAVGAASGSTIDETDISAGPTDTVNTSQEIFVVRETAPTIELNSGTPSGTGFVVGDQETVRFDVSAHSNEDVIIEDIMFKTAISSASTTVQCASGEVESSDFDLYNLSEAGTSDAIDDAGTWTLYDSSGDSCGSSEIVSYAKITLASADYIEIPAGETQTISLYFDSTGLNAANDDSLQFTVAGDLIVSTFLDSSADLNGALTDDASGVITTAITADGTTSNLVDGDVLCISTDTDCSDTTDEKVLLVTGGNSTSLTVVRGYLGTTILAHSDNDNILRIPGALLWRDNGSVTVADADEDYNGADLVDDLPMSASNAMSF